jgi:hypothetical protein
MIDRTSIRGYGVMFYNVHKGQVKAKICIRHREPRWIRISRIVSHAQVPGPDAVIEHTDTGS